MPLQSAYILNRSLHLAIKKSKNGEEMVSYTDFFFDDLYQLTPHINSPRFTVVKKDIVSLEQRSVQ